MYEDQDDQPPRIDVEAERPHFHGHEHGQGEDDRPGKGPRHAGQELAVEVAR